MRESKEDLENHFFLFMWTTIFLRAKTALNEYRYVMILRNPISSYLVKTSASKSTEIWLNTYLTQSKPLRVR